MDIGNEFNDFSNPSSQILVSKIIVPQQPVVVTVATSGGNGGGGPIVIHPTTTNAKVKPEIKKKPRQAKKKKDPNAPSGPCSAFTFFFMENQATIKTQNPVSN